jgi:hypothetical protein
LVSCAVTGIPGDYSSKSQNYWLILCCAQRQALQARRAKPPIVAWTMFFLDYYILKSVFWRRSEGSETGGVIFRRLLSRRLEAHVG